MGEKEGGGGEGEGRRWRRGKGSVRVGEGDEMSRRERTEVEERGNKLGSRLQECHTVELVTRHLLATHVTLHTKGWGGG